MKCARTACDNQKAECWHTHTWDLYCIRCARRINEYNPGCIVTWRPDTRDGRDGTGFISSDGKFILSPILGRNPDMPKWVLYVSPEMRQLGDYYERRFASEYIRNHFRR